MKVARSNTGFSLASVLVGVAIISIVGLGIAAAVSGGIDGMSHMRNVALAEDVSGLVSGMMGDPDYCAMHFAGKKIGPNLPSVIEKDVVFKDVAASGAMGSNEILKAGTKYQNVLKVESISLNAEHSLGARRYLGSVKLSLKGNTGYNLYFNRSVPLQIATDTTGNITACARAAEVVHGTTQGVWSDTCNDFAAKGWPTKDACIKDGRWHRLYSHNSNGIPTFGTMNGLVNYINEGAEVKIGIPAGSFLATADGYFEKCTSTIRDNGKLLCLGTARMGVPDWDTPIIRGVFGVVFFSTGLLVYDAPSTSVRVSLDWYVKF